MSEIVNLNKVRKDRERLAKKTEADQNARRFGRTKAERLAEAVQSEQLKRHLDRLKFEDD